MKKILVIMQAIGICLGFALLCPTLAWAVTPDQTDYAARAKKLTISDGKFILAPKAATKSIAAQKVIAVTNEAKQETPPPTFDITKIPVPPKPKITLEDSIKELKAENNALKARLASLEAIVKELKK